MAHPSISLILRIYQGLILYKFIGAYFRLIFCIFIARRFFSQYPKHSQYDEFRSILKPIYSSSLVCYFCVLFSSPLLHPVPVVFLFWFYFAFYSLCISILHRWHPNWLNFIFGDFPLLFPFTANEFGFLSVWCFSLLGRNKPRRISPGCLRGRINEWIFAVVAIIKLVLGPKIKCFRIYSVRWCIPIENST